MIRQYVTAVVAAATIFFALSTSHAQQSTTRPSVGAASDSAQTTNPSEAGRPYLGITTSQVPEILRAQLDLPQGFGLVIDSVEPGSPAARAGLQKFDVLHKLNDQIIVNQEQLATLIGAYKISETIHLTVIHHAQPTDVAIALTVRPADVARHNGEGRRVSAGAAPGSARGGSMQGRGQGEYGQRGAGHGGQRARGFADRGSGRRGHGDQSFNRRGRGGQEFGQWRQREQGSGGPADGARRFGDGGSSMRGGFAGRGQFERPNFDRGQGRFGPMNRGYGPMNRGDGSMHRGFDPMDRGFAHRRGDLGSSMHHGFGMRDGDDMRGNDETRGGRGIRGNDDTRGNDETRGNDDMRGGHGMRGDDGGGFSPRDGRQLDRFDGNGGPASNHDGGSPDRSRGGPDGN